MSITERERSALDPGAIPADTFASRLMLVRVHAGYITIKDAAEKCDLNYGSWSNWERGSRPQELVEVVEAISTSLGIDRDWLLFGGPLTAPPPVRRRDRHGRLGSGTTVEYGVRIVRSSEPASIGCYPSPIQVTTSRPTSPEHRPGGRNDRSGSAPGLPRPSILPRRIAR